MSTISGFCYHSGIQKILHLDYSTPNHFFLTLCDDKQHWQHSRFKPIQVEEKYAEFYSCVDITYAYLLLYFKKCMSKHCGNCDKLNCYIYQHASAAAQCVPVSTA